MVVEGLLWASARTAVAPAGCACRGERRSGATSACDGAFFSLAVVLGVAQVGGCRPGRVGRDETAVAAAVASI